MAHCGYRDECKSPRRCDEAQTCVHPYTDPPPKTHKPAMTSPSSPPPLSEDELLATWATAKAIHEAKIAAGKLGLHSGCVVRALTELRALKEAGEWKDIKDAPRDGTWIRGWRKWRGRPSTPHPEWEIDVWRWFEYHEGGAWQNAADTNDLDEGPTHWKPLDTPPDSTP